VRLGAAACTEGAFALTRNPPRCGALSFPSWDAADWFRTPEAKGRTKSSDFAAEETDRVLFGW
jgi:hypothetical protein